MITNPHTQRSLFSNLTLIAMTLVALMAAPCVRAEPTTLGDDEKAIEKSLGLSKKKGLRARGLRTRGLKPGQTQAPRKVISRGGGFVPRGGKMVRIAPTENKTADSVPAENHPSLPAKDGSPEAPVKVYEDSKAVFNNLLFVINSTQLADQASYDELNKLSRVLKAHPSTRFFIEGHTCDLGGDEANKKLSWQRAEAVKLQLTKLGVSSSRLVTAGYGETELPSAISPYESKEQQETKRKQARRVVIRQLAD